MLQTALLTLALVTPAQTEALGPGRHTRALTWENVERTYHVYIPKSYDAAKPAPVVLALHGASMTARIMEGFCGLSAKAEEAGFIVVYPNGGAGALFQLWNSGTFPGPLRKKNFDDVGFIARLLDDVANKVNVDPKRVYCAGLSNGGMMAYRVAAELSDRVAAVASVAGTMVCECKPKRPVPVLHFHGTKDTLVPFNGVAKELVKLSSVDDTIAAWVKANGCNKEPVVTELPVKWDTLKVTRKQYNSGKNGAEVVLYVIDGAGHVWPGRPSPGGFLGKTTYNISANDVMWEFFEKHGMK
ncbi:MAG: prolyl oligopeptidase family serine peptidase [Gemmataceae bacterium]|nr:prolyl oligopeptidase family serine peptidase [Gemmataceae bacterium]